MREVTFIRKYSDRWKEVESFLKQKGQTDPDQLAKMFTQLNDDLAYAQTYYPDSQITKYLNQLTIRVHQKINVSKKHNLNRIYTFFKQDYPLLIYKNRKFLFFSFLIFAFSLAIGALSAANDHHFVRLILGDYYVEMTLNNIRNGEPMGVYASSGATEMFFSITINNIKVAFLCFAAGILASLGTGYILLQNGIMLGAFQYFFVQHNVFKESVMGVWMHGTIEIFSIIVAGAAGLVMGNALIFPGTYKRKDSFKKGALEGVKITFGLIPFFIIAGFIESYLTRHSEITNLSLAVIISSIIIIAIYFFIYPFIIHKKQWKSSNNLEETRA